LTPWKDSTLDDRAGGNDVVSTILNGRSTDCLSVLRIHDVTDPDMQRAKDLARNNHSVFRPLNLPSPTQGRGLFGSYFSPDREGRKKWIVIAGLLICLFDLSHPERATADPTRGTQRPLVSLPQAVPAPEDNPTTPEKVALGKKLFFDARLSGDNTMSCATCHLPEKALGDGLAKAKGHEGKTLARNTPTLLNVGFHSSFFWDGRAKTLEEQALGPIQSPDEMSQDLDELEEELNAVLGYVESFQAIFGTNVDRDGISKALAAFQRTLVTGPSPFDRYLAGDEGALSRQARRGLEAFVGESDCVRCHRGPLLSDGEFYRLGVSFADKGLGGVTRKRKDHGKFRTPSLRNVAQTGPYMHDGSFKTLTEVVEFYYRGVPSYTRDGLTLDVEPLLAASYSDIPAIVAFLESLSGELPEVTPPELP
jgi:cytochrome c peroxidase